MDFDFFISHASTDERWAEWIARELTLAGFRVYLDIWNWAAGDDVVEAMAFALDRADRVVAIYSSDYFARPFAQAELRAAFHSRTETGLPRVVPVMVEPCSIPDLYSTLLRIDLVGADEPTARQRLLSGVGGRPQRSLPGFPGLVTADSATDGIFPGSLPRVWNIPPRNPFFCGRELVLRELRRALPRVGSSPNTGTVVSLHGIGGIGKTQVAGEFAYRSFDDYSLVWWVDADKPDLIVNGLVQLADELGVVHVSSPEAKIKRLWSELASSSAWLLIYDNVDDLAAISPDVEPPRSGHWLITSRLPGINRIADITIELSEFLREESLQLLQRRAPVLSSSDAGRIAESLGDLPLAIEQAGCFIADSGLNASDYIELLQEDPGQAGLDEVTTARHPGLQSVVATSMNSLRARHPRTAHILETFSFFAPEPVPVVPERTDTSDSSWEFGVRIGDVVETTVLTRELAQSGLVSRTGHWVQLHRIVRLLILSGIEDQRSQELAVEAATMLSAARPGLAAHPADWSNFSALIPHVEAVVRHNLSIARAGKDLAFSELVLNCVIYCYRSGRCSLGIRLAHLCLPMWRKQLGESAIHTLRLENNLGACMVGSGDFDAAVSLFRDLRDRADLAVGPNHRLTLGSAVNAGVALVGAGRYDEAVTELTAATTGLRMNSRTNADGLRAADNLARAMIGAGQQAEALALAREVHEIRLKILNQDDPDMLESSYTLGVALAERKPDESRRILTDTLDRQRKKLGADHPDTVLTEKFLLDGRFVR